MITSITPEGKENYYDFHVPIHENYFAGGSWQHNSGKSAVVRALKWVCLNEWDGRAGEQTSWGETSTVVTLSVDGHVISRGRDQKGNLYVLDDQEYPLPGGKVPAPIAALLNVGSENFQGQQDQPFWMLLSAGQAASALNEIFSLSQIDAALDNVGAEVRRATLELSVAEQGLKRAREERDALGWVPEASAALARLEELADDIAQRKEALGLAEHTLQERQELLATRISVVRLARFGRKVVRGGQEVAKSREKLDRLSRVVQLCLDGDEVAKQLWHAEQNLAKLLAGRCPLCGRE